MDTDDKDYDLNKSEDLQRLIAIYNALTSRRSSRDTLNWQIPAFSLTAEAFLLTISLNPHTYPWGMFIASLLGIFIALSSMQLFEKNLYLETIDSILVENIEKVYGFRGKIGNVYYHPHMKHDKLVMLEPLTNLIVKTHKYESIKKQHENKKRSLLYYVGGLEFLFALRKIKSRSIWKWTFLGFFIANFGVFIYAVAEIVSHRYF